MHPLAMVELRVREAARVELPTTTLVEMVQRPEHVVQHQTGVAVEAAVQDQLATMP